MIKISKHRQKLKLMPSSNESSFLFKIFSDHLWYSSFPKLWQSCSDPHPKISPIAIFAFYSLSYSLMARLQDNSRPKSPTKVEAKRKLQQFTVSGWLIINWGESGSEQIKKKCKTKITFSMKSQSNKLPLFAPIIIFIGY